MARHVPRWDHRSGEEWLQQAARFERMAERFQHHPQLEASFNALARDATVRAKDGQPTAARVVAGADLRRAQHAPAANHVALNDFEYLRRREAQEREAASRSSDLRARRVHLEMAIRYGLLRSTAEPNCRTRVRLVSQCDAIENS